MVYIAKNLKNAQIYNENLNHFFTEKLNTLTPEQRHSLPYELDHKIFARGLEASAEKLTFNEIAYMLQTVFRCDITITVSDEINGLSIEDYQAAIKAQKGKLNNGKLLDRLKIPAAFVLGGKEVMQSLLYMSHVCCTNIYNLVKKNVPNANHAKNKKFIAEKEAFNKTVAFLVNYEANKKRITMDYGLTMPEWYALIYFGANEGWSKDFYNRDFKYSYNSNKMNLNKAVRKVFILGYLTKRTFGTKDKYTISAKGMDLLNRIFNNILLKT